MTKQESLVVGAPQRARPVARTGDWLRHRGWNRGSDTRMGDVESRDFYS